MSDTIGETPKQLADILDITPTTVRYWIKKGKLVAKNQSGRLFIPLDLEQNDVFIIEKISNKRYQKNKPWVAENIKGYAAWHEILDEFTWLLKISYGTLDQIKSKEFRADKLFSAYIAENNIKLDKIKRIIQTITPTQKKLITDDIKRGWYNEIAFLLPLKASTLGYSFRDISINKDISEIRFAFPSWKIISSYYAVYFYLRSVILHLNNTFSLKEHNSTINYFKNNVSSPLSAVLWKFPFDIKYDPRVKVYRSRLRIQQLRHTRYRYSAYPRTPWPLSIDLFEHIYSTFRKRGKTFKKPCIYTIFDYLHDFRVWANYLDIDNLLSLRGTGYKAFLDQNLSLILFFIGGISELCYISAFGEEIYIEQLQKLYDEFVTNSPSLEADFVHTSIFQRMIIYQKLGFISENIQMKRKYDINAVSLND